MEDLRARFARFGIDYELTMARFVGSEDLYWRCFDLYLKDENLRKLGEALAENDLENAFLYAHTLKGVVGNMGFDAMFRRVCEIVESLRMKDAAQNYRVMYERIVAEGEKIKDLISEENGLK